MAQTVKALATKPEVQNLVPHMVEAEKPPNKWFSDLYKDVFVIRHK